MAMGGVYDPSFVCALVCLLVLGIAGPQQTNRTGFSNEGRKASLACRCQCLSQQPNRWCSTVGLNYLCPHHSKLH